MKRIKNVKDIYTDRENSLLYWNQFYRPFCHFKYLICQILGCCFYLLNFKSGVFIGFCQAGTEYISIFLMIVDTDHPSPPTEIKTLWV